SRRGSSMRPARTAGPVPPPSITARRSTCSGHRGRSLRTWRRNSARIRAPTTGRPSCSCSARACAESCSRSWLTGPSPWRSGWSPIRDVTFRGTYSTAFRAPNILELYLGQSGGNFESSNDPCATAPAPAPAGQPPNLGNRCRDAPGSAGGANVPGNGITVAQINSINGGNPNLQPEKARIGTVGVVFEPQMVRGLTLTSDFYWISMNQLIGSYGTQLILNKCYGVGVTQDTSTCALVQRDAATGGVSR